MGKKKPQTCVNVSLAGTLRGDPPRPLVTSLTFLTHRSEVRFELAWVELQGGSTGAVAGTAGNMVLAGERDH